MCPKLARTIRHSLHIQRPVNRRHRRALIRWYVQFDATGYDNPITPRENFYYLAHHERKARHAQN